VAILLRNLARTEIARSFFRDIQNENDFYHFYVGRTQEWDDEEAPESPIDSVAYNNTSHRNMLFTKRINSSDAVLMVRRIDWVSGVVYDHYDDSLGELDSEGNIYEADSGAQSLIDANFYVMTDEFNVYKCLDNNGGAISTIKPTGTDVITLQTEDGYVWKFLFRVETADVIKFLTPEFIPVRKMSGVGAPLFDVNGSIDDIIVTNGGSSYETAPNVIINGDGTGATAHAVLTANAVSSIVVDTAGFGYTFAYITFDGGGGDGAVATVTLGGTESSTLQENVEAAAISGTVDRIDIINPGVDYETGDINVTIVGDGQGAEAFATANVDGEIIAIEVTNPGEGYTFAEITISNTFGVGTNATARAIVSPVFGHGGNAQRELLATNLCISVNLTNDTSDYFLNNDFRQLGIIKNIGTFDDSSIPFQEGTGTTCYVIGVDSTTPYNMDDIITSTDGGRFIVVQIVGSTVHLLPIIPLITVSSTLTNITNPASNLTINTLTDPDVYSNSGEIIYIDNRTFIIRQEDQVEKIRTILTF
jgi:hypothetical protein